jgi:hypothetical protein
LITGEVTERYVTLQMKLKSTWKLSSVTGEVTERLNSTIQSYRKNRENLIL